MFIDVPILSHCSCSVMLDPSQSLAHKKCFCQYDMSFMTTLLMITCNGGAPTEGSRRPASNRHTYISTRVYPESIEF